MSSFWQDRPTLVTGAAGFIGSHVVDRLLADGAQVRALVRYNSTSSIGFLGEAKEQFGDRLDLRHGTVTDPHFVRDAADGTDTILHLAALIGIPYSYVAPSHYVETNVGGTLAVLEAARAVGTRRVVVTSTSETFGSAQYVPMDEKHPLNAQSPYAATKIAADQLALSYHRSFETPVVVLRPFNTFGPRQSTRAVIPTIINQLLDGPRVTLGSLDTIRDMNPVPNTVEAFLASAEQDAIEGMTFVVGSGVGRTIQSIVDAAAEILDVHPQITQEEQRVRPAASEVDRLICNYDLAKQLLGYEPRVTFESCLQDSIAYYSRHRVAGEYAI